MNQLTFCTGSLTEFSDHVMKFCSSVAHRMFDILFVGMDDSDMFNMKRYASSHVAWEMGDTGDRGYCGVGYYFTR